MKIRAGTPKSSRNFNYFIKRYKNGQNALRAPSGAVTHFYDLKQFRSVFVSFPRKFCHYFKEPSLLVSFVEILFLREPMTLKYNR